MRQRQRRWPEETHTRLQPTHFYSAHTDIGGPGGGRRGAGSKGASRRLRGGAGHRRQRAARAAVARGTARVGRRKQGRSRP
eukprot:364768-Chlamydomonas_euryale.AAC.15